jgi:hypothetical protein
MALQYSVAARNARADNGIRDIIGNAALLRIYTGTAPADCATAATGQKLSEHTLGSPFAPGASSGVQSPTLPSNVNALATGTAGYWRVYKSDGTTCVIQGSVGTSGADLNLNTLSLVTGGPVQVNSWTFTEGGA